MTVFNVSFEVLAQFDVQVEAETKSEAQEKLLEGGILSSESLSAGFIDEWETATVLEVEQC